MLLGHPPMLKQQFGGTERELESIYAHRKSLAELRAQGNSFRNADNETGDPNKSAKGGGKGKDEKK